MGGWHLLSGPQEFPTIRRLYSGIHGQLIHVLPLIPKSMDNKILAERQDTRLSWGFTRPFGGHGSFPVPSEAFQIWSEATSDHF